MKGIQPRHPEFYLCSTHNDMQSQTTPPVNQTMYDNLDKIDEYDVLE